MSENIKATNWPVPAKCRRCHADILICPVLDHGKFTAETWVVPLVVDAWPEGQQWKDDNKGGFWELTVAYKPHVCNPAKIEEILAANRTEEEEDNDNEEEEE